jgi:hypothetical protein
METIAARHGIYLAPLYNAEGPVEGELNTRWNERENDFAGINSLRESPPTHYPV